MHYTFVYEVQKHNKMQALAELFVCVAKFVQSAELIPLSFSYFWVLSLIHNLLLEVPPSLERVISNIYLQGKGWPSMFASFQ